MSKRYSFRSSPRAAFLVVALVCIALAAWGVYGLGIALPAWPLWILCSSVVAFLFYGWDKLQASQGGWRVPELVLHILALAGGFPGAWLGRRVFRHKTKEPLFLIVIILSAILHIALAAWAYFL